MLTLIRERDLKKLTDDAQQMRLLLSEAAAITTRIAKADLGVQMSEQFANSAIGNSIALLKNYLRQVKEREEERSWFNQGLAEFLDLFRNTGRHSLNELMDLALSRLVRNVKANQGGVFILQRDDSGIEHLELIACYAYSKKRYLSKRIEIGQGLAGQCALEREMIYLKKVPGDYINITSGLGEATPSNVLIVPLMISDEVVGVLEIASFELFENIQKEFIGKIAESFASVLKNSKEREHIEKILAVSQKQAEELRAQEEEMRQNMEEMAALQEQLARNEVELKNRLNEMEQALQIEKSGEVARIREEEKMLLESKLEAQRKSYELIIERLKKKLQLTVQVN